MQIHTIIALIVMVLTIINPRGMVSLNTVFTIYYIFSHFAPNMGVKSPLFIIAAVEKPYIVIIYTINLTISITSFFEKE